MPLIKCSDCEYNRSISLEMFENLALAQEREIVDLKCPFCDDGDIEFFDGR